MQNFKIVLTAVLFTIVSCTKNTATKEIASQKKEISTKSIEREILNLDKMPARSLVLSCGSGCAMTYNAKRANKYLNKIAVKFNVDMFIDEELTENFDEEFTFFFDESNNLLNIKRKGETEDFLLTQSENAQISFKKFAEELAQTFLFD